MEPVQAQPSESLADLARLHGQDLITFAYLLTRDRASAQDIVQTVLTRLSGRDLESVDNLVGYAKRSIVHETHQLGRRHRLLQRLLPRLVPAAGALPTEDVEARLQLWAAMGQLTAQQRAALVLRYYEDLDDAAIAEVLDCAPATVRSHLSRGLSRLRPLIAQEDP